MPATVTVEEYFWSYLISLFCWNSFVNKLPNRRLKFFLDTFGVSAPKQRAINKRVLAMDNKFKFTSDNINDLDLTKLKNYNKKNNDSLRGMDVDGNDININKLQKSSFWISTNKNWQFYVFLMQYAVKLMSKCMKIINTKKQFKLKDYLMAQCEFVEDFANSADITTHEALQVFLVWLDSGLIAVYGGLLYGPTILLLDHQNKKIAPFSIHSQILRDIEKSSISPKISYAITVESFGENVPYLFSIDVVNGTVILYENGSKCEKKDIRFTANVRYTTVHPVGDKKVIRWSGLRVKAPFDKFLTLQTHQGMNGYKHYRESKKLTITFLKKKIGIILIQF